MAPDSRFKGKERFVKTVSEAKHLDKQILVKSGE